MVVDYAKSPNAFRNWYFFTFSGLEIQVDSAPEVSMQIYSLCQFYTLSTLCNTFSISLYPLRRNNTIKLWKMPNGIQFIKCRTIQKYADFRQKLRKKINFKVCGSSITRYIYDHENFCFVERHLFIITLANSEKNASRSRYSPSIGCHDHLGKSKKRSTVNCALLIKSQSSDNKEISLN